MNNKTTIEQTLPKETKGKICELYANKHTMKQIQAELNLSYKTVSRITDLYLGINEKPINLTFIPSNL
jgi:AraC-like DNA-binding protein